MQKKNIISKPRILFPNGKIDLNKWAVIACDQFTSPNENYWQKVEKYVEGSPSTLNIIFPEFYLTDKENIDNRINKIQQTMEEYVNSGILVDLLKEDRFIYTRRTLSNRKIRQGLVVALDLEAYSYKKGEKLPIRPTEGIVEERLPIRMKIRKGAPLEFPHILMLIDDPERFLIEPLGKDLSSHQKLYDFDLMMGGGHAEGYAVTLEEQENNIFDVINKLSDDAAFTRKHDLTETAPAIAIAVGDGNHSLASAKAVWEETKSQLISENKSWEEHPARYAMAEIINMHDEALEFEPIHRVLFNTGDFNAFIEDMKKYYETLGATCELKETRMIDGKFPDSPDQGTQTFFLCYSDGSVQRFSAISVKPSPHSITVGTLQMFLDNYLKNHGQVKIDYLHGTESLLRDSSKPGDIGFFLPPMNKEDLFKTVAKEGVTPRKTFSMGEADTKAYYIMGRRIV
ncbi:hypothetical protein A2380_03895 [candidate division WWE3 bacterium RIFOXYB1_FULL_43_24]|uniref:DUF1015 domain-containing protein n=2 Tax=Katanobacteria TaxID=422282 RepID=A0A0G0YR55_UNCKA|nr:MAG: hypothetical protein UU92_C0003G0036 [candidate division WWE3 bacterium GW2011_GWA1_42_12]KKS35022.1 MAG: hypothetical protein UU97_C0003G0036 [candidate division WWE3 bacterium GW2011_GWD1_42_14]KKS39110.1 MAG: hypothetical protein UV00_C0004G0036 [candidate division WWE3 bacterium GW2011_GWF1_42_14]KKS40640.1 MAG: hypothetical protein UV03_C0004G0036 [candidate division WWE3 bacterium GW2011_GWE1_42_16]KKS67018.1 MAG: hypothetical protein UV35_C0004G0024 [candidate division WWE3 bacte